MHFKSATAGVPNLRVDLTGPQPVRNRAAQQEVSGGLASKASSAAPPSLALPPEAPAHSQPPFTPPSVEELSSMKPVPGDKKVGDRCATG